MVDQDLTPRTGATMLHRPSSAVGAPRRRRGLSGRGAVRGAPYIGSPLCSCRLTSCSRTEKPGRRYDEYICAFPRRGGLLRGANQL